MLVKVCIHTDILRNLDRRPLAVSLEKVMVKTLYTGAELKYRGARPFNSV